MTDSIAALGMNQETKSEEDLACRVQAGCATSFTELAERMQPRLLFVLRRRLGHEADAEDVAQNTLMRAFEKIQLYNPKQKFSPWLFTIALRLATDYHRKKQLPTTPNDAELSITDPQPSPAQQAMDQEKSNDLWTLAEKVLKPDQWTALWLLYGEGQSVKEIAQSLNRTSVSIRVLLHRARKILTPHLAKFAEWQSDEADCVTNERVSSSAAQPTTLLVARTEA